MRLGPMLAVLFACGGDKTTTTDAETPPTFTTPPLAFEPTWEGVDAMIGIYCVGCHRPDGDAPALPFPDALALDLIEGSGEYVVPGDPIGSTLWRVLSAQLEPGDYDVMPLGSGPLLPQNRDHVEQWIASGAEHPFLDVDIDGDGFSTSQGDCDERDPGRGPGADELCGDGIDNDCDGAIDDESAVDAATWYPDADGDGAGDDGLAVTACTAPVDHIAVGGDCDDADPALNTADADADGYSSCAGDCDDGNAVLSPLDGDGDGDTRCDGDCDDNDAALSLADGDGDGFSTCDGDCDDTDPLLGPVDADGDGVTLCGGDCDDGDPLYHPGAPETDCADPNDYNCDGVSGFTDGDGDGFPACQDCNDASAAAFPGGVEVCGDGLDNDCVGGADGPDATDAATWYRDADLDGQGDALDAALGCTAPIGYIGNALDCDDTDPTAFLGGTEVCDGADNDCNGPADDAAIDAVDWWPDADGDGYGDGTAVPDHACDPVGAQASNGDDCDDTNAAINPGQVEVAGNGDDDDCDGTPDNVSTLTADVQPIFDLRCAGCHGGPFPSGAMDLSGDAYDDIVGVPSAELPSMNRITPGDPQNSYLWHKLMGTQATVGGTGNRMPNFAPPLGQADLDTIETWILQGAAP